MSAAAPIVDLHAAAFTSGNRAVVIAGAKGAGKTSLLCHAIVSAGAALVSNDRTFVDVGQTPPAAEGIPTVVSVRGDTLRAFPQLGSRAEANPPLTPIVVPARPGQTAAPERRPDRALLLSPARFARRLGAEQVARAPLSAILLPEVSAGLRGWQLVRLEPGPAATALEACLYGAPAARKTPTLFAGLARTAATPSVPIGARLARLVAAVPVFVCRIGPDAYDMPIGPLLDALDTEEGR